MATFKIKDKYGQLVQASSYHRTTYGTSFAGTRSDGTGNQNYWGVPYNYMRSAYLNECDYLAISLSPGSSTTPITFNVTDPNEYYLYQPTGKTPLYQYIGWYAPIMGMNSYSFYSRTAYYKAQETGGKLNVFGSEYWTGDRVCTFSSNPQNLSMQILREFDIPADSWYLGTLAAGEAFVVTSGTHKIEYLDTLSNGNLRYGDYMATFTRHWDDTFELSWTRLGYVIGAAGSSLNPSGGPARIQGYIIKNLHVDDFHMLVDI